MTTVTALITAREVLASSYADKARDIQRRYADLPPVSDPLAQMGRISAQVVELQALEDAYNAELLALETNS